MCYRLALPTRLVFAVLRVALPLHFWFGNLLAEAVWHHSRILHGDTPDFPLLMTFTATHRALHGHTRSDILVQLHDSCQVEF